MNPYEEGGNKLSIEGGSINLNPYDEMDLSFEGGELGWLVGGELDNL